MIELENRLEYRRMEELRELPSCRLLGNLTPNHEHHGPRQFRQALYHPCRACRPSWRPFLVHWISVVSSLAQLTHERSMTFSLARPKLLILEPGHHSTAAPSLSSPSLTPFVLGIRMELAWYSIWLISSRGSSAHPIVLSHGI